MTTPQRLSAPRSIARRALALLLALALLAPTLAAAPPARAAACTVTSAADSGPNTLRAAIADSGCDTIGFAPGLGTITLASPLVIGRDLAITGPGAAALTLSGDDAVRVFDIAGSSVAIGGLTIARGRATASYGAGLRLVGGTLALADSVVTQNQAVGQGGGGLYVGAGTVTITNTLITANRAGYEPLHNGGGGGIYADDFYGNTAVTLIGSTVSDNTLAGSAPVGGISAPDYPGNSYGTSLVLEKTIVRGNALDAVYTTGSLSVTGSTIRENGSGLFATGIVDINASTISDNAGTGFSSNGGNATVYNSVFNGNRSCGIMFLGNPGTASLAVDTATIAGNKTCGLLFETSYTGPTLNLVNSVVSGNGPDIYTYVGGGLQIRGGTTYIGNVTISGNGRVSDGGGIRVDGGSHVLDRVTIVGNVADADADGNGGGGGIAQFGGTVTIGGSIVAGNTDRGGEANDCLGSPASAGANVFGGTCPAVGTDRAHAGPLVGVVYPALADNGGPTRTHALVPDSPALDAGGNCPPTDQRGVDRPQGAACDAGAYESVGPPSPLFGDVPPGDPAAEAIAQLAARGIINGCDPTAVPPLFCPAETTLRHQMAALIVRAMPGWQGETWPNTFTDPTEDAELWRRVGTLQRYGVVGGYTAESCIAQGKTPPCYGPLDPVLKAQAISFVTRAMVAKGYWVQQPTDPALYGGALVGTGHEQDTSTYWHYTRSRGGVPDHPEAGGFPLDQPAPRAWFARLLWTAIQGTPAAP